MSISLDEFRAHAKARPLDDRRIADLKAIAQELPRADALTGDANWDYFLRFIEAGIKTSDAQADLKRQQAARLVLTDEHAAKAAAVEVMRLEERAKTLREIITLPKWLKENSEAALSMIAALEKQV